MMGNPDSVSNQNAALENGLEEEDDGVRQPRLETKPFENKVADVLRGYKDIPENVINHIIKQDINFKDLNSLVDEDLQLLGIESPETRSSFLNDFSKDRFSSNPFAKYLEEIDDSTKTVSDYKEEGYRNVAKQMLAIGKTLEILNVSLKKKPDTQNYLISDNEYVSTATLKATEQLWAVTNEIRIEEYPRKSRNAPKNWHWKSLLAVGGVIVGFYAYKCCKKL